MKKLKIVYKNSKDLTKKLEKSASLLKKIGNLNSKKKLKKKKLLKKKF